MTLDTPRRLQGLPGEHSLSPTRVYNFRYQTERNGVGGSYYVAVATTIVIGVTILVYDCGKIAIPRPRRSGDCSILFAAKSAAREQFPLRMHIGPLGGDEGVYMG